ncbi:MAG: hypothetical protein RL446_431, partial [Pseudomonadota bacterium]
MAAKKKVKKAKAASKPEVKKKV